VADVGDEQLAGQGHAAHALHHVGGASDQPLAGESLANSLNKIVHVFDLLGHHYRIAIE
jgi:hypothetical protein